MYWLIVGVIALLCLPAVLIGGAMLKDIWRFTERQRKDLDDRP